jgi:hypothetical protein
MTRIMAEYSASEDHAGVCLCPVCTAKRFIDIHVSMGYEAHDLLESLAYTMILVLTAAPDHYRAGLTEEILDGIHDRVHFNTTPPTDKDVVH